MHSSRMRTAHSLTISPYLVVSHACPQEQPCMPPTAPPQSNHATMHAPQEQPCTPQNNHALPGATTPPWSNHACPPEQPCMPPQSNHACLPGATTPPWSNHECPPRATMHAPQSNHIPTHPRATMHAPLGATMHASPEQPHTPRANMHAPPGTTTHTPPVNRMWTHASENITLPQLRCGR